MAVEARVRVHHRGCLSERTRGGLAISQLSGDGVSGMFLATAERPEDLDPLLADLQAALVGASVVSRSSQVALVRGGCPPSGVEECILAYGCSIVWPALFCDGRELFTIIAPSRQRVRQLLERLADLGKARLEGVSEVAPESLGIMVPAGRLFGSLTSRQRAILAAAVEAGYYRTPRATSAARLARSFGVGRTTFEEHLRKAEAKVLAGLHDAMRSTPGASGNGRGKEPGLSAARPRRPSRGRPSRRRP